MQLWSGGRDLLFSFGVALSWLKGGYRRKLRVIWAKKREREKEGDYPAVDVPGSGERGGRVFFCAVMSTSRKSSSTAEGHST